MKHNLEPQPPRITMLATEHKALTNRLEQAERERDEAITILHNMVKAIDRAMDEGCIDHLDCCNDAGRFFDEPLKASVDVLRRAGRIK